MYKKLAAALLCGFAQLATACESPLAAADEVRATPALIKTAVAGPRTAKASQRESRIAQASPKKQAPPERESGGLVLAAVALMAGIALRRYVVGRQ